MSSGESRGSVEPGDVRDRIGAALDQIIPPPAPVLAVMRRGRRVRVRRRAGLAVGLAVVLLAIVITPRLVHHLGLPPSPSPAAEQPKLTIEPVGPEAVRGLIAQGTINGSPWTIRLARMGKRLCIEASDGPGMACQRPGAFRTSGAPVSLQGGGDVSRYFLAGPVASTVRQVRLVLSDRAVLRVDSVRYGRQRWIGMEMPGELRIMKAIAYSVHGEVGHAIPFYESRAGIPTFVDWQRPGETGQPRITRRVGSGLSAGQRWSATEHTGPWGYCMTVLLAGQNQGTDCTSEFSAEGNGMTSSSGSESTSGNLPWWFVGAVPTSVRYLEFAISDGRTIRVRAVAAGMESFYAFALGAPNLRVTSWDAYDSAGRRVSGGRGLP